jgi:hypothetical protein
MISDQFEKAVARACLREANRYISLEPFRKGDDSAVTYGAFLPAIAAEAGLSIPQTRRRMRELLVAGRAMRNDTAGGSTRWWLAGLASSQKPEASAPTRSEKETRQAVTTPSARIHWSEVLGVERDCSTREARAAFASAMAALNEADPDYPNQRKRVHEAIDACCREHEIQIQE